MPDLDTLIAQAHARQAEREAAAAQAEADEHERRRQAMIDQLIRDIARVFPDELIGALALDYRTQDVYPQCYASFLYQDTVMRLWTDTQRDARFWHVSRPGATERATIGREIIECRDHEAFIDNLLCAIDALLPF